MEIAEKFKYQENDKSETGEGGDYEKHNGGSVRHREPAKQKRNRKTSKRKKEILFQKLKRGKKQSRSL